METKTPNNLPNKTIYKGYYNGSQIKHARVMAHEWLCENAGSGSPPKLPCSIVFIKHQSHLTIILWKNG